jgi:hypothetical protein
MPPRNSILVALFVLLGLCAGVAQQKTALTADRILDQYEKSVKSSSTPPFKTFHYVVEPWGTIGNHFLGSIEGWFSSDGRFVEHFTALSHGYYSRGFNGKQFWYTTLPMVSDKGVDLPEQFRKTFQVDQKDPAIYGVQIVPITENWRKQFSGFQILGQTVVEGHKAIVLRGNIENGAAINFYFDASTMLLVRADFPSKFRNVNNDLRVMESTRYFKDYTEISGWKIPRSMRIGDPNSFVEYFVRKAEFNVTVDDKMFEQPK